MSYNACGFSYTPPSQLLMTGQHTTLPYTTVPGSMPPETLVSQVSSGTTMCYDGRFFAYPRLSVGDLYGPGYPEQAAAAAAAAGYMAGLAPSSAVLYPSSLTSPYDLKDSRAVWTALPQAAGYPCDSSITPYGPYGDRFDPVDSEARRRNATRETTSTLKAWLNEHRKNPYPTKGEKIMLAIITKMTLTQVSTWFANARRRLKKENKMTWEPRNKTGDDLDDVSVGEDDEKVDEDQDVEDQKDDPEVISEEDRTAESRTTLKKCSYVDGDVKKEHDKRVSSEPGHSAPSSPSLREEHHKVKVDTPAEDITDLHETKDSPRLNSEKPKIWSLAQTATSQSPPPVRRPNFFETLSASNVSNEERLRMSRLFFQRDHRMVPSELRGCSPLHRDLVDIRTRNIQDSSSTESSLSSPPLWRGNETHNLSGLSVNAFDTVSGASSASCSPSLMNASPSDASTSGIPVSLSSFGYSTAAARFFNCTRFLPPTTDISSVRSEPHRSIERFVPQSHLGQSLDLRTLHTQFLRPPLGYPVNFSALTHHPEAVANRTKTLSTADGEDNRSNI